MSSIPLPALAVRPPEQQNPLSGLMQVMQIKSLQQQQALAPIQAARQQEALKSEQMQNTLAQRDLEDQQKIRDAFMQSGGDMDKTLEMAAKAGVQPKTLFAMKAQVLDQKTKLATLTKDELANTKAQSEQIASAAQSILSLPPEQRMPAIQQAIPQLVKDPQQAQQLMQSIPQDPAQQEQWLKIHALSATSAKDQIDTILRQKEISGQEAGRTETARHNKVEEAGQASTRAETRRHNVAMEGQLQPDALDMAAMQFAKTGQMPQVGRGGAVRAQIINRASQLYPKVDLASNSADYAANKQSLEALTKQRDTVSAFENTALKNLDQFLSTAKKVVDFGSPLINKPVREAARLAGSSDQAAYNAARQVALTEIAKVVNNPTLAGQLSDSGREEVMGLNPASASLKQIYSVAQILKQDMANRHESYDDQIKAIQSRISGNSAPPSSGGGFWNQFPEHK